MLRIPLGRERVRSTLFTLISMKKEIDMKKTFYTEFSYVVGILFLTFGTALMEKANFGMSMIVAPAYLLHLKVSMVLPWFSFGVAEYTFQAFLLILMILALRQFRVSYLFSFVTAVMYGIILDLQMKLVSLVGSDAIYVRLSFFVLGMLSCALGVAFLFHTYIAPEVYELFVKELVAKYHFKMSICKTTYDCISCVVAVIMSFAFFGFGNFKGIYFGTVICALLNGFLIGNFSKLLEKRFTFIDGIRKKKTEA